MKSGEQRRGGREECKRAAAQRTRNDESERTDWRGFLVAGISPITTRRIQQSLCLLLVDCLQHE